MFFIPHPADFHLVQDCLEGHEGSLRELRDTYRPIVLGYFRKHGVAEEKANEWTDALWVDLLADGPGREPELARYSGKAALGSWLYPLVMERLNRG